MTSLSQLTESNICRRIGETAFERGRHYYRPAAIFKPHRQANILKGWCFYVGLYCLKPGKKTYKAVDYAQQVDPQDTDKANKKGFLRCAKCQYPITRKIDRIEMNERHQHVFANPHGHIYQIACFAQAPGCVAIGAETSQFSWFPGYAWQIALCGQCLTLLGWAFRSSESQFFGLIIDKLTGRRIEE